MQASTMTMSSRKKQATFPFTHLSTELALEIIRIAAVPDFSLLGSRSSTSPHPKKSISKRNPYAPALNFCRVSHAVRAVALRVLIHTVVLTRPEDVIAFIHALRIQKYHKCMRLPLAVDYTKFIRRIWIGQCWDAPPSAPDCRPMSMMQLINADSSAGSDIDYTLLAPILFSARELGLDFSCLHVLYHSLEAVWMNATAGMSPYDNYSAQSPLTPLPWKTTTLTLKGGFWRWRPLTSTAEGSAFLASIERLVLLIPTHFEVPVNPHQSIAVSQYASGAASVSVPWTSFRRLKSVVSASPGLLGRYANFMDVEMQVQPVGNSEASGYRAVGNDKIIHRKRVRIPLAEELGKECVADWEQAWASGIVG
ncbi:hypothetical protein BJ138DRAFT_1150943 [Hygrophoropsis aurantiaca]|uniref:Uncharacterized protein n=1 Tax=Hygrophoropsis aurantiaca TaxID=72124 RepID=A0ACB8ADY7_9AGAM|nr:hypothetical protein BJ138DRAFT_1150943 [Hygrophoropsis aurantiaca]